VAVIALGDVFVGKIVVLLGFISFFFENDRKVNAKGGGAVIVVVEPKGAGGASFPMVGIHVEVSS